MSADFFQQQDSARRRTFQLAVYFVLAILILIALVYGLLLALSMYDAHEPVSWWQPELLLLAAPGVGLVVGGASAIKVAQLASGGQAVAAFAETAQDNATGEAFGARRSTAQPFEGGSPNSER